MNPLLIAGGILTAGILLYWIARTRRLGPEPDVGALLKQLDPSSYQVRTGVILHGEQGMIRLDHAVVSPYGVFVVQVCRDPGRIEVRPRQETWRMTGGGSRGKMYNPIWDIRKVIQKLERLVGDYPYIPLVVFTRGRLTGDTDPVLQDAGKMISYIRGFSTVRLPEDRRNKILGILG